MGGYYGETYYGGEWEDPNQYNTGYLKSLATLSVNKGFESSNRYAAISDENPPSRAKISENYDVPISDLICPNRAPGKSRRLEHHKVMFGSKPQCKESCRCDNGSQSHNDIEGVRPVLTPALAPNREPLGWRSRLIQTTHHGPGALEQQLPPA